MGRNRRYILLTLLVVSSLQELRQHVTCSLKVCFSDLSWAEGAEWTELTVEFFVYVSVC